METEQNEMLNRKQRSRNCIQLSLGRDEIRSTRLNFGTWQFYLEAWDDARNPIICHRKEEELQKLGKFDGDRIHNIFEKHPDVFEKRILFQWTRKYLTLKQTCTSHLIKNMSCFRIL